MGVSYIPGPEALLAPAASQLSQAIFDAINPNAKIQKALQAAVIQNPALIQSFADIEFSAPGTLERLGFGPIGQTFAQTPPSPEAATRVEETKARKAKAGAVTAEATFTAQDMVGFGEFLKNNPGARLENYQRRATGETATERAKRPVVEAEADRRLEFLKDPKIGNVDFLEIARLFETGKLPGSELTRYLSQPETRDAFLAGVEERKFQRQQALTRWTTAQRDSVRGQVTETMRVNKAYDMFQRSGNAGSLQAWETILFEPEGKDKAAELATKDFTTLSPDERYLVEAYNASLELRVGESSQNQRNANIELSKQIPTFNSQLESGEDESVLNFTVSRINDALQIKNAVTGRAITAHYGAPPGEKGILWMEPGKRLYFTDAEGNVVETANVLEEVPIGAEEKTGETLASAQAAADYVRGLSPSERQAQLVRWEAEDKSPGKQFHKTVLQLLGDKPPAPQLTTPATAAPKPTAPAKPDTTTRNPFGVELSPAQRVMDAINTKGEKKAIRIPSEVDSLDARQSLLEELERNRESLPSSVQSDVEKYLHRIRQIKAGRLKASPFYDYINRQRR